MDKTKKLKDGQKVVINIPFTYYIGKEGHRNGKILKTVADCEAEVVTELESRSLHFARLFMQAKIDPENR